MRAGLIEKFIDDDCTAEEAEQVLNWLSTTEGQQYLEEKIGEDYTLLQDERIQSLVSETKSQKMWGVIRNNLDYRYGPHSIRKKKMRKPAAYWGAVAAAFAILAASMFYLWPYATTTPEASPDPIYYQTGNNQQKALTLRDGSKIRLNSNSKLWIYEPFGEGERKVRLKGEAYFEVVHDEDRPFIIHTPNASVKDLGTVFNVRAFPDDDNVQVSVNEGKVSLWSSQQVETEAAILNPGQFGYLNLDNQTIEIDEFEHNNYLSWMNRRIIFDNMKLKDVSRQLSRIYDVSFEYASPVIKELTLSSTFERGSLEKALEVVALTLDLSYNRTENRIRWERGHQGSKTGAESS
ncbi:FecR family protein [Fodinibius sediminis]|uniref:FecR family protein n=1 Tax=Fodinibius sediminis TaxID=1214077 RepID=A0A521CTL2_9BACT|nr:FecR domain-containing protein [Fodinibius sediminis]SMO62718.1 FecR family protein [Fodinibius sediminis]